MCQELSNPRREGASIFLVRTSKRSQSSFELLVAMASLLNAMASILLAMASNLRANSNGKNHSETGFQRKGKFHGSIFSESMLV